MNFHEGCNIGGDVSIKKNTVYCGCGKSHDTQHIVTEVSSDKFKEKFISFADITHSNIVSCKQLEM